MSTQEPGRAPASAALTPLPRVEDLPTADRGYDRDRVEEAFEAFGRHVAALQAHLRVLQAAPGAGGQPTGHAVRMDSLHLVRSAAEFADTIERDAQDAAARQIARTEEEVRERLLQISQQEAEVERIRAETERQRADILNAARTEARDILANANQDAAEQLRDAEARGARLLEQSRHQATELANAARAEVEQTLEWARAQAEVIVQRARTGAERLLSAAGHGDPAVQQAVDAIVRSAQAEGATQEAPARPPAPEPPRVAPAPEPEAARSEPEGEEEPGGGEEEAGEEESPESPREGDRPQPF
jgi:F0F1-type ATP synthase membrane subunit b/b'